MKINSVTTNYCNYAKSNQTPQFKGTFLKGLYRCEVEEIMVPAERVKINTFFEKYLSPGVNVVKGSLNKLTLVPWYRSFYGDCKLLAEMPKSYATYIKYYATNVKAIEDDVLDMTMNYFKTDKYAAEDMDRYINYIKQQREYAEKFPERLPASYKAKLDLFEELINSKNI